MDLTAALAEARRLRLGAALRPASARAAELWGLVARWEADADGLGEALRSVGVPGPDADDDVRRAVAILRQGAAAASLCPDGFAPRGIVVCALPRGSWRGLATVLAAAVPAGAPVVAVGDVPRELAGAFTLAAERGARELGPGVVETAPVRTALVVLPHADIEAALAAAVAGLWRHPASGFGGVSRVLVDADRAQEFAFALQRAVETVAATPVPEAGAALAAVEADGAMVLGGDVAAGVPQVLLAPGPASWLAHPPDGMPVVFVVPYGSSEQAVQVADAWGCDVVLVHGSHGDHTRRVARALSARVVEVNASCVGDEALLSVVTDQVSRRRDVRWSD